MPRNILKAVFITLLLFPVASCADENIDRFSIADKAEFTVEIADTEIEREKGLMHRKEMGVENGMLFIFPDEYVERNFWMKNTYIPLDMIFLNDRGVITHIHRNALPLDETVISSNGPAAGVLEVNAGQSDTNNFEVGDQTNFLKFVSNVNSRVDRD
tara:strand:- start:398 stop:868 length:471 start_codon:yes stop_codon:yes gene_type:complete